MSIAERNLAVSRPRRLLFVAAVVTLLVALSHALAQGRWLHGIVWPEPPVITPGDYATHSAPSDAIILFDGKNLDAWKGAKKSTIDADGGFTVKEALQTKQAFGDCQLHV